MSVTKRLKRLTGETAEPRHPQSRTEQINDLRRRIEAIMNRRPAAGPVRQAATRKNVPPLEEHLTGEELASTYGKLFVSNAFHDENDRHGHRSIGEYAAVDMEAAAFLSGNNALADHRWSDGLFLDTETTGLAGGTGTVAFLIGLGWFEGRAFVTRQIFARDFSEEKACLAFLSDIVKQKRFLITFNGKAFDVGLLATRYIMNRLPDPLTGLPHLDLLHPARRLVGHRLENSRLATIEPHILGLYRENDVPGSEIPQRYFDWLRSRNPEILRDVFEHNRLDVISMAGLSLHLTELISDPPAPGTADHRDLLAAARLRALRADEEGTKRRLLFLIESDCHGVAPEAGRMLSLLYKRSGQGEKAAQIWERMIADDPGDVFAATELAKWHEHRTRNIGKALAVVTQILQRPRPLAADERGALEHRRRRLEERFFRSQERADMDIDKGMGNA
jgi:uncharacterized protein YprB with RNaseH-like and TPR domain